MIRLKLQVEIGHAVWHRDMDLVVVADPNHPVGVTEYIHIHYCQLSFINVPSFGSRCVYEREREREREAEIQRDE